MTRILVTGVGAIIGYGIVRSLRAGGEPCHIIGADIYAEAVGQVWCDDFVQAPRTDDASYAGWLKSTLLQHRVMLLFPGIEPDVDAHNTMRYMLREIGVTPVLNREDLITLCRDKWAQYELLNAAGSMLAIPSSLSNDYDTLAAAFGVPFLLKPRRGQASKGQVRVTSRESFAPWSAQMGEVLMAQKLIGHEDEEYTVGAFGDGMGALHASIAFRRRLASDGSTGKIWHEEPEGLRSAVEDLARIAKPLGPTNFQFRRDAGHWKLLEINPRISSSTSLRTAFGYNEAMMCLHHYKDGASVSQPTLRQGFACRYIEDYVIYDRDHF